MQNIVNIGTFNVRNLKPINQQIMYAIFFGSPRTTIISYYSPTNASNELDITTFYNQLFFLAQHISTHIMLVISGDMNAQIGKDENGRFCLHTLPNRNDKYLADFLQENSISYQNTKFQKREGKL